MKKNYFDNKQISITTFPNPFNDNITFRIPLKQKTDVEISIYDLLGKQLYYKKLLNQSNSLIDFQWDGKSTYGQPLSKGVYMYKVQTNHFIKESKVVKD